MSDGDVRLQSKVHEALDLSKFDVLSMILFYFIRHNITVEALVDLLKLINRILGSASIPETFFSFTKIFKCNDFIRHYVCSSCSYYFGVMQKESINCSCPCC